MDDKDLLYEVAKLCHFDSCDAIWWRMNEERTKLLILVNCNDLFWWGTADCELITEENLPILRKAVEDVREIAQSEFDGVDTAFLLFVCRVREMRPQGAYYKYFKVHWRVNDGGDKPKWRTDEDESEKRTVQLKALFDACGPERETRIGNPEQQSDK